MGAYSKGAYQRGHFEDLQYIRDLNHKIDMIWYLKVFHLYSTCEYVIKWQS